MYYIAIAAYIHPETQEILIPKNTLFEESVKRWLAVEFGFDTFIAY